MITATPERSMEEATDMVECNQLAEIGSVAALLVAGNLRGCGCVQAHSRIPSVGSATSFEAGTTLPSTVGRPAPEL